MDMLLFLLESEARADVHADEAAAWTASVQSPWWQAREHDCQLGQRPELDPGYSLLSTEHFVQEAFQILEWAEVVSGITSDSLPFFLWLLGTPAWEKWLFTVWAGDGSVDRELLVHLQRITSSDYQMIDSCDSSHLASTLQSRGACLGQKH